MLDPLDFKQPLWIDMGAGNIRMEGFTTLDAFTDADIKAPMWEVPLPDGCVDIIQSTNSLEHLPKRMVIPTLKEWHRLLKVGGQLRIAVPDLVWACEYWLKEQGTDWSLDIIYGHQLHGGEYHFTGFTLEILFNYVQESVPGGWNVQKLAYYGGWEKSSEDKREAYQRMIGLEAIRGVV